MLHRFGSSASSEGSSHHEFKFDGDATSQESLVFSHSRSSELPELRAPAPVVIDQGFHSLKVGLANDEKGPQYVIPSVGGYAPAPNQYLPREGSKLLVAEDILRLRGVSTHRYLGSNANAVLENIDWRILTALWHRAYSCLGVNPEETPLLLGEPPLWSKSHRETMVSTLFETLQVPSLFFSVQAALALYAVGRTTGMTLDIADSASHAVPVENGAVATDAVCSVPMGGRQTTEHLASLLGTKGIFASPTSSQKEIIRQMKEMYGYVAYDHLHEMRQPMEPLDRTWTLPDGSKINLTTERFLCAEPLFNSDACLPWHSRHKELQNILKTSYYTLADRLGISQKQVLKGEFASNLLAVGGTTMMQGFLPRLRKELMNCLPVGGNITILAPEERRFCVWRGGSILASMESFQRLWLYREDYQEFGPSIIHRRCF